MTSTTAPQPQMDLTPEMNEMINIVFANQNTEILRDLLDFEKNEELILNWYIILQYGEALRRAADEDEYQSPFDVNFQLYVDRIQVHDIDCDSDPEEFFDAKEHLTELDRTVPQNGEEPQYWRDLLDLEEYEDAPENVQELLEVALGEQRRIPEMRQQ